jgi:hypothetical protein
MDWIALAHVRDFCEHSSNLQVGKFLRSCTTGVIMKLVTCTHFVLVWNFGFRLEGRIRLRGCSEEMRRKAAGGWRLLYEAHILTSWTVKPLTELGCLELTLSNCIWEVLDSNLGQDSSYSNERCHGILSFSGESHEHFLPTLFLFIISVINSS